MWLAGALWLNYTAQTYIDGYHTPRHMIYGGAAGTLSLLAFDDLCGWLEVTLSSGLMGGDKEQEQDRGPDPDQDTSSSRGRGRGSMDGDVDDDGYVIKKRR